MEVELESIDMPTVTDHAGLLADREIVDAAMQRLDESGRAIVVLHYFLGMPLTEVAATLGTPIGTVKSRLHRALGEMRVTVDDRSVADVAGPGRAGGMTTPTRLERNLPRILGDLSAAPTPEYLDDVFARTGRMRQRPAWTFPERWLPMADITRPRALAFAPPFRSIVVALLVIALLVVAALVYVGRASTTVPAPFGPARNGLIPYVSAGDVYLGDPVTGATRLAGGSGRRTMLPRASRPTGPGWRSSATCRLLA